MPDPTTHWSGRRVLVTGCAEFLGSAVVAELLEAGAEVIGLVRDREAGNVLARHQLAGKVRIVHGREDLFRIHSTLAVHDVSAVFHLVPRSSATEADQAASSVFNAVRRFDPRIPIVLSLQTQDLNTISTSHLRVGVGRFGSIFGPGDSGKGRLVPAVISALLRSVQPPTVLESARQDYVFVRDAARGCLLLSEHLSTQRELGVFETTFRSGWSLTERELTDAICEVFHGRSGDRLFATAPEGLMAWGRSLGFGEALASTVQWYRTNRTAVGELDQVGIKLRAA